MHWEKYLHFSGQYFNTTLVFPRFSIGECAGWESTDFYLALAGNPRKCVHLRFLNTIFWNKNGFYGALWPVLVKYANMHCFKTQVTMEHKVMTVKSRLSNSCLHKEGENNKWPRLYMSVFENISLWAKQSKNNAFHVVLFRKSAKF